MQNPVLIPVHVAEIVRATTLAIRRRHEILGPICKFDPFSNTLVDVLARRPGPPNHWSEAWINVQLGCAYSAAGNTAQAKTALERAVLVGGQFDHPLTSTALLELGHICAGRRRTRRGQPLLRGSHLRGLWRSPMPE